MAGAEAPAFSFGLVWMSIDNDETPETATKYVAAEHLPWPDYHDGDGVIGDAFGRYAIPLGVLVDSGGTITFYAVETPLAA